MTQPTENARGTAPGDADHSQVAAAPRIGLFATCLVDLYRPTVGFAAATLLERAGCRVEVPAAQACCGQPAWNAGDRDSAAAIARRTVALFEGFDHVVAPSGSCAGMLRCHYPGLLADDPAWAARARALAAKSWELVAFLADVLGVAGTESAWRGSVAYHDGCSGLRELGISAQPRALLAATAGAEIRELSAPDVCCGFGGTFCVKYPGVSGAMVDRKVDDIVATGAGTVAAGDMGCLMNIAGRLSRRGIAVEARHIAEILADMADGPAIGGRV
ncbi:MAG: (Fe-S)-binding protein [Rhodospirillaceae bacterium]